MWEAWRWAVLGSASSSPVAPGTQHVPHLRPMLRAGFGPQSCSLLLHLQASGQPLPGKHKGILGSNWSWGLGARGLQAANRPDSTLQ